MDLILRYSWNFAFRTDFCKANHFPIDFHSVVENMLILPVDFLSANYSSRQEMGSAEAQVGTGILP